MIGDSHLGRCLVTGGTGTFGQAFRAHVLAHDLVDELVVLSRDELKQAEQREACADPRVRWFLGDVRDRDRLRRAFAGCDVVVHAAALKRIEACAYDPGEAVATNVDGTRNAVEAALDAGVGRFLLLSTDKACEPVNLYGATKLVAEKLVCAANAGAGRKPTRFGATRYGNVFGSRGSVLERWVRQARAGEPLTLTHREATRFWMTKVQAVAFVLDALAHLRGGPTCPGGEVHVPRLPSVRMVDVAASVWNRIVLFDSSGNDRISMRVVGLGRGEKLHESLVGEAEARRAAAVSPTRIVLSASMDGQQPEWQPLRSDDAASLVSSYEAARLVREALTKGNGTGR